jgi:CspA family cold shock protein
MSEYGAGPGARQSVSAVVKWYNPTKGFGFVQMDDGSPDAFLHASVIERGGHPTPGPGAKVVCDVVEGRRGPQVAEISSLEPGEDPGPMPSRGAPRSDAPRGPVETVDGTVKFYNAAKGFGFVAPDGGGQDVFISGRLLTRVGVASLDSDQRVRVGVRMGDRGPQATSLEVI